MAKRSRSRRQRQSVGSRDEIFKWLQAGRFEEARAPLARLAYEDPHETSVALSYVECLFALKKFEDARDFLQGPASEKKPRSPLWASEAQLYLLTNEYKSAIDLLRPRVESGLGDDRELDVLVEAHLALGGWDEAADIFGASHRGTEASANYSLRMAEYGRGGEAVRFLERWLEQYPAHARILDVLAEIQMELERFPEAQRCLEQLVELEGGVAKYWYHLGMTQEKTEATELAATSYRKATSVDQDYYRAWTGLGTLLSRTGERVEATAALSRVTLLRPQDGEAWHRLGYVQRVVGEDEAATHSLRQALRFAPHLTNAWDLLVRLLQERELFEEAIEVAEEWLKVLPGDPVAEHMLAAASGSDIPTRASSAYVEAMFDGFAASFNSSLERLEYKAPESIGQLMREKLPQQAAWRTLDAGCGTGLMGPYLRPLSQELVGVDLSGKMLDEARATKHYDQLVQSDLVDYLGACEEPFDLVVVADTLMYFGDLREIMELLFCAIRPGGALVFTVEEGPLTGDEGYYLQPNGRYVHTPPHVIEQLGENGIPGGTIRRIVIRKETDKDVMGLLALCEKPVE